VASAKTTRTELATAAGLVYEPDQAWPEALETLTIPGLQDEVWKPILLPAAAVGGPDRDLLLRALDNGRAFRQCVLQGRRPDHIAWLGGAHAVWTSDIPRDLTVDGVWFIQAKYDSTCILNTSPGSLVDDLLVDHTLDARQSWYEEVAQPELTAFYGQVRADLRAMDPSAPALDGDRDDGLPDDVRDLDRASKAVLKRRMRGRTASPAEQRAYAQLCRVVSLETTLRWRHRLEAATVPQRTQMLFRMLRIAGGPYWLLGLKGREAVRLHITDSRSWRDRFELKRFTVVDAHAGQPQVNWRADVVERATSDRHPVEGFCELRWSHGKLQGNPECKVQVVTPLDEIPGYEPMA
jgi:hypothetical protein